MESNSLRFTDYEPPTAYSCYISAFRHRLEELTMKCIRENPSDAENSENQEELNSENIIVLEKILEIKDKIAQKTKFVDELDQKLDIIEKDTEKIKKFQHDLYTITNMYTNMSFDGIFDYSKETKTEHLEVLHMIAHNVALKHAYYRNKKTGIENEIENMMKDIKMLKQIISACNEEKTSSAGTSDLNIICSVCDENKITIVINPCGHTLCDKCAVRLYRTCFTCRKDINGKIKMQYN